MEENKLSSYLLSGTIGYSLWKKGTQILLILHDNHSTESYCKKTSMWIADLLKQLNCNEWDILIEEPNKMILSKLKSLWATKHVRDIRALDHHNIYQCDIRFNDDMKRPNILPSRHTIERYVKHAPLLYKNKVEAIHDSLLEEKYRNNFQVHSTDSILFPECIDSWSYIAPYLPPERRLVCLKDFIFEGHLLSRINNSVKNIVLYAGSWHCRAVQGYVPTMEGWRLLGRREFPLGHKLERNCIEINI
jgi:hypothetical protein